MNTRIEYQNKPDRSFLHGAAPGRRVSCAWTDCAWSAPMKAFIVYDDAGYKARAAAALQGAAQRAGVQVDWEIHYWRSDLLTGRPAAAEAQADAADAALVLVASRHAHLPPVWLMVWLENWARNRQVIDSALAMIADGKSGEPAALGFPQLCAFARRHGLTPIIRNGAKDQVAFDFFARHFCATSPLPYPGGHDWKEMPAHAMHREWGINE